MKFTVPFLSLFAICFSSPAFAKSAVVCEGAVKMTAGRLLNTYDVVNNLNRRIEAIEKENSGKARVSAPAIAFETKQD